MNEMTVQGSGALALDLDAMMSGSGVLAALKDELGEDARPSFAYAKTPSQGMTSWQIKVDEDDDDPEIVKAIDGVVLLAQRTNAYWEGSIDDGGDRQPICRSEDAVNAIDRDGCAHRCGECPMNKFGSDGKRGKACKNSLRLYVLRDGLPLPTVVYLSATGIKVWDKYVENLMLPKKRGQLPLRYTQVMTRIGLKVDQNADGIKYSKPTFECVGVLDDTTKDAVACYAEQMKTAMARAAMEVVETPFDE